MKKHYILLILIIAISNVIAQQTGSFEKDIQFNNTTHYSAYYVPISYDATKTYPLVVALHGCGGNAIDFRNSLISISDSLDAIIVCPDMFQYRFEDTLGEIIVHAIDSTINSYKYNIDTNAIYLTGFSCNGRETFRQAWRGLYAFNGIIPFNSWIPNIDSTFNFKSKTPTCICSGDSDPSYNRNTVLYDSLLANNGFGKFITMPGIGHQWDFPTQDLELMKCFKWIDSLQTFFNDTMTTTGIFTIENSAIKASIYPNPSNEKINISLQIEFKELTVSIFNAQGQILYEKEFNKSSNIGIELSAFSNGIYYINIQSDSEDKYFGKFKINR